MIDTKTKLIGLIGNPLEHSFSPIMHNKAYKRNHLNYLYMPLEVDKENIEKTLTGIKNLNFIGFNVTIPHKINIMKYLDNVDPIAEKIGSVNTVKITNNKLTGYNTDGTGFIRSLKEEINIEVNNRKILILGAGGASRSISLILAERNAKEIYIANRTLEKADELCQDINNKVRKCSNSLRLDNHNQLEEIINIVDIIINTTSVGMYPNINESPIDVNLLNKNLIVVDIVYNPTMTKLLKEAKAKGCKTHGGLGMLANQAAEAFEIWTGLEAPIEDMRKGLEFIIKEKK